MVCTSDARRDFGAAGDGKADDTAAVQKTIDAARAHGKGALAYLPKGVCAVSATLEMTGSEYALGGSVRLGTITAPGLWVKDNQSAVFSDFYVESSQQYGRLEGDDSLPPGRVVLQGAKFEIDPASPANSVDIHNYKGAFLLGTYQY